MLQAVADPLPPIAVVLIVIAPLVALYAVIAPIIQLAVFAVLTICTYWPTVKVLPVCTSVSDAKPIATVKVLVLVACVPGELIAVAALAAAWFAYVSAYPACTVAAETCDDACERAPFMQEITCDKEGTKRSL